MMGTPDDGGDQTWGTEGVIMQLHGLNLIGNETAGGATIFRGVNPATSQPLDPPFHEASAGDVDRALKLAEAAFQEYRHLPAARARRVSCCNSCQN